MPLGYRMGRLAMDRLGVEREKDHGFFVFTELGEGHPQSCLMDGKLAATFYHPKKGSIRFSLQPDFIDAMGKFEFFAYRKKGMEPSELSSSN
jgi:formylmethanofuran dehydrogenase subunit E